MTTRSYRPGDWFGVVGERAVVLLPPTEKPRVAALWELVDGGAGFDVTLDALISGGLRELPGFVLVSTGEGETKVVLRGPARARLTVDGEEVELEGSSATTWVERSLVGVERMSVVLSADPEPDLPTYVVDGGLFRLSQYDEGPVVDDAPSELVHEPAYEREHPLPPDPEPEPLPETEPEPLPVPPPRSPEPPTWRPPPPAPPAPDLDHDGLTVTGSWEPPPPPGIPGQPPAPDVTVPVARLHLSSGEVIDVDRAIVLGRAPEARAEASDETRLVTVPSPQLEVSSTHVEIRPGTGADHGTAVVEDLASTNGTILFQPGIGPESLPPGVAVQLLPGAVIDLGDGVTIQVTAP